MAWVSALSLPISGYVFTRNSQLVAALAEIENAKNSMKKTKPEVFFIDIFLSMKLI